MEKKRKLPARAAAREQSAKKRNTTPQRSETPVPPPAEPTPDPKATPVEEPPASLPKAITAGKPLPTVETPQPDDLSNKDYQSIAERYSSCCLQGLPLRDYKGSNNIAQWRPRRVVFAFTIEMDHRVSLREVLDKTHQEKGRPTRGPQQPTEGEHDEAWTSDHHLGTSCIRGNHVRCQRH